MGGRGQTVQETTLGGLLTPHTAPHNYEKNTSGLGYVRLGRRAMEGLVWMTGVTLFARFCKPRTRFERRGGTATKNSHQARGIHQSTGSATRPHNIHQHVVP